MPDLRSPAFKAEARRQVALLDQSDDERAAGDMMTQLAEESWSAVDRRAAISSGSR